MSVSLRPSHLELYAELRRIFVRYGRSDLTVGGGLEVAPGCPRYHGNSRGLLRSGFFRHTLMSAILMSAMRMAKSTPRGS